MGISLLGKNIKEYRIKKGLSLKKLTEIAEVGIGYYLWLRKMVKNKI